MNAPGKRTSHVPTSVYVGVTLRYATDKCFADMMQDWSDLGPSLAPCDIRNAIHDCPPLALPGREADVNGVRRFVYRTLTFRGHWIDHPTVPLAVSHAAAVCQITRQWRSDGSALLEGPRELAAFSDLLPGCGGAPGLSFVANVVWTMMVQLGGPEYERKRRMVVSGVDESESSEAHSFSDMDCLLREACAVPLPTTEREESLERVAFFEGMVGALLGLPPVKAIRHGRTQSEATNGSTPGPSVWAKLKPKTGGGKARPNGWLKHKEPHLSP
jgi:hypothetical protein